MAPMALLSTRRHCISCNLFQELNLGSEHVSPFYVTKITSDHIPCFSDAAMSLFY